MDYLCAICEQRIGGWSTRSNKMVRDFFCRDCFGTHKEDIMTNAEWVLYLRRLEKNRRHAQGREEKLGVSFISIEDGLDISNDGEIEDKRWRDEKRRDMR